MHHLLFYEVVPDYLARRGEFATRISPKAGARTGAASPMRPAS
jgi:hypothetical protein